MVTLLGLPRITISAVALSKVLPNVMDLPFISGFISSAINTALAEYVAPKSLTIDMQRLISGDDVKKDTDAIGVLVVHIHQATGVKRMDASGGSGTWPPHLQFSTAKPSLMHDCVFSRPVCHTNVLQTRETAVFDADHQGRL